MRLLLLTGGRHPYQETTPVLTRFLRQEGHTVLVTRSARQLAAPSLPGYNAIIFNTRRRKDSGNDLTEAQRTGLDSFVDNGGGLVSIHISPDSCPDWPQMKKITGGGWVSEVSWHPPFGRMKVFVRNPNHPIARGVTDFDTDDELYCDLNVQPGIEVFLGAFHDGVERPLGWTAAYGKGKVANIALGHAGVSQKNPSFQRLVLNAVDYVTA